MDTPTISSSEEAARSDLPPSVHILPIASYLEKCGGVVGSILHERPGDEPPTKNDGVPKTPNYITVVQGQAPPMVVKELLKSCDMQDQAIAEEFDALPPARYNMPPNLLSPRLGKPRPVSISFATISSSGAWGDPRRVEIGDYDAAQGGADFSIYCHYGNTILGIPPGGEIIRKVHIHDSNYATVEQRVTFFAYPVHSGGWSGVLLSDAGRREVLPWDNNIGMHGRKTSFMSFNLTELDGFPWKGQSTDPFSSRAEHPYGAMAAEEQSLCTRSPAALVADLLCTSALSWNHILTFLQFPFDREWEDTASGLQILRRHKTFLRRAKEYFTGIVAFVDEHEDYGWPVPTAPEDIGRLRSIFTQVRRDYAMLLDKTAHLSERFEEEMQWAVSGAAIRSSQSAVSEGKMMRVVTNMAFIFLPMSLVSSIFGMNVAELQEEPYPRLWTFFVVGIPVTIASLSVLYGWHGLVGAWAGLEIKWLHIKYTWGGAVHKRRKARERKARRGENEQV